MHNIINLKLNQKLKYKTKQSLQKRTKKCLFVTVKFFSLELNRIYNIIIKNVLSPLLCTYINV